MRILYLEGFFSGSHQAVAEGFKENSRHDIELITLPGRLWRQRLRWGGALLAERVRGRTEGVDLVVAATPIDLAQFKSLAGPDCPPLASYLHENQLTYPTPDKKGRDSAMIHIELNSAMVADYLVFNSEAHRMAFLDAVTRQRSLCGDVVPKPLLALRRKTRILHPGVDFTDLPGPERDNNPPAIIWNHRWNYDKNPGLFLKTLQRLKGMGLPFRLILLGGREKTSPEPTLNTIRRTLGQHIWHEGFCNNRKTYLGWLSRASFHVSTAIQENFGIGAVEAMAAGARPFWPNRLSYPELLPEDRRDLLWTRESELLHSLAEAIAQPALHKPDPSLIKVARQHDWSRQVKKWDDLFEEIVAQHPGKGK